MYISSIVMNLFVALIMNIMFRSEIDDDDEKPEQRRHKSIVFIFKHNCHVYTIIINNNNLEEMSIVPFQALDEFIHDLTQSVQDLD